MVVEKRDLPLFDVALSFLDVLYTAFYTVLTFPFYLLEAGDYWTLAAFAGLLFLILA